MIKIDGENWVVVTPWHKPEQRDWWLDQWRPGRREYLLFQDACQRGCGATKNAGIRQAIEKGAHGIVVLDDDCGPSREAPTLTALIRGHVECLQPQPVPMFEVVTDPPSRGTPFYNRTLTMPVVASMGFWLGMGDYDAPSQLVHGPTRPMTFKREVVFGKYFALCGMNLAFRIRDAWPFCQFVDVPRFDDIWMGWKWQAHAWRTGQCFNLRGPLVTHARQSNVWNNILEESPLLEENEYRWQKIAERQLYAKR